ncbi:MAG: hypothetical protein ACXWL2_04960, partial [Candidatus Chromulinivorax sp.]
MSTKTKQFRTKATLICLTPLLCNAIQAQENDLQNESIEQTKFNAANSAILDTVSNIVKQQVNLGTFIITGGNPDNNLTSIQEGVDQINAALGDISLDGIATATQVNNLGTSSDTSGIRSDFVHLGATSGDVSNLNTRLTTIDTNLATKATSTQVTTAQTNIQGTAGTDGLTLGAIEGTSFNTTTDSLHVISGKVATATQVNNLGTLSDTSGLHTQISGVQSAIQGTAGTNGLTLGAIEGTSFDTTTDSLHVISGKVATATNLTTLQTTANTINTNMATSAQATAIEGTSFDTATDSLHV